MKRFTLRLFGVPVASLDVADLVYVDEDEDESPAVGGGSSHNFTIATPFVDERYLPWEDEGRFGFGVTT